VLDKDADESPPDSTKQTISIHALIGIQLRHGRTMQLRVDINGVALLVLLDSRSTHNFIDTKTAAPPCKRTHHIQLLPGTTPVVVHPYHYAHAQKDELEQQCTDMLHSGVIRPSSSTFSAPVLLIKSDGSWQFYVDYRALSAIPVKD
jgi:hypothetical protein